jgi:addiction module HigA family antidote
LLLAIQCEAVYPQGVIRSFRSKETERLWLREPTRSYAGFETIAKRKLDQLNAATSLFDLAAIPGNHFKPLAGDRLGQYGIRINNSGASVSSGETGTPTRSKLLTTIGEEMARKPTKLAPIHPGETLLEDFMKPLRLSANRLAIELHVPVTRINDIAHGRRSITADTALRLARYFGMSAEFWVGLQSNYDLEVAKDASAALVESQVKPRQAA